MQCWCSKYACRGTIRSERTYYNHNNEGYKNEKHIHVPSLIGPFDKYMDLSLYTKIPESKTLLYPGAKLTILEAAYEVIRDFVFSKDTRANVTKRCKLMKEKLLPEGNLMPESFEAIFKIIFPFLAPLHRFNVCPNDCVIFRNEYATIRAKMYAEWDGFH